MVISFVLFKGDVAREIERIFITKFTIIHPTENCPQKIREKAINYAIFYTLKVRIIILSCEIT